MPLVYFYLKKKRGAMWTDCVHSYTTPTLALGPRLRCVLAEGVDFTAKSGAQSNQALVGTVGTRGIVLKVKR